MLRYRTLSILSSNKLKYEKFARRVCGVNRIKRINIKKRDEVLRISPGRDAGLKLVINLSLRMTRGRGMNSSLHLKNPSSIESLDGASGRD